MDLVDARTDGLKLSLKLYHARELQLSYQQLTMEAPLKVRITGAAQLIGITAEGMKALQAV